MADRVMETIIKAVRLGAVLAAVADVARDPIRL
jgi:hypothetical protein